MELSRLRVLFYFAAFLLGLSVCYIYAEDAPRTRAAAPAQPAIGCELPRAVVPVPAAGTHLLFRMTPQHASFSAPSTEVRLSGANAAATPAVHIASRALLSQVEMISHSHRRLLRIGHTRPRPAIKSLFLDDSAVLGIPASRQIEHGETPAMEAQ